jgi:hypothetical protein
MSGLGLSAALVFVVTFEYRIKENIEPFGSGCFVPTKKSGDPIPILYDQS